MAIVKLSAGERRRLSAFFTCLVLAALAWVVTTLSNPYTFTVKRVLNFKNTPQKRAFRPLQSDTVDAIIKGNGWQMLFSKMKDENKVITVDVQSLENTSYVVLGSQLRQINDRDTSHNIIAFDPDTLYFDFSNRSERKVHIKLVSALKYMPQFGQSNNAILKPADVTITGPSSRIDKIKEWDTDSVFANDVNATVRTRINLAASEGNISIIPKAVDVVIPVDEFTEKTLEIPVKLINNNNYYNVKIFPQKVKVTFITSLKKYAETNEDFFEAESDLNLWKLQGYSILPVKLTRFPPFCKIVSVDPQNIDFIIRK